MAARNDCRRLATGLTHPQTAGVWFYTLICLAVDLFHPRVVSAQGTVQFNLRLSGTSHIYAPLSPSDTTAIVGQGTNDAVPSGTTSYGGRALIGANGLNLQYG